MRRGHADRHHGWEKKKNNNIQHGTNVSPETFHSDVMNYIYTRFYIILHLNENSIKRGIFIAENSRESDFVLF